MSLNGIMNKQKGSIVTAFLLGECAGIPLFHALEELYQTFYTQPCAFIASATFKNPAMFAPAM